MDRPPLTPKYARMQKGREAGPRGPTISGKLPEVFTTKPLLEQTEETHWMGTFGNTF